MLGMLVYRGEGAAGVRVAGTVRILAVPVRAGESICAACSARAAARTLRRAGVRVAVFPPDYVYRGLLARGGIEGPPLTPFYQASAAALTRCYMTQRGIDPRRATLAVTAEETSPQLVRLVTSLAGEVRHMTLAVARGGGALAWELRRTLGLAVRLAAPGEQIEADLTVSFPPCEAEGAVLPLSASELTAEYEGGLSTELLAGLWAVGGIEAETLGVRRVTVKKSLQDCG